MVDEQAPIAFRSVVGRDCIAQKNAHFPGRMCCRPNRAERVVGLLCSWQCSGRIPNRYKPICRVDSFGADCTRRHRLDGWSATERAQIFLSYSFERYALGMVGFGLRSPSLARRRFIRRGGKQKKVWECIEAVLGTRYTSFARGVFLRDPNSFTNDIHENRAKLRRL
jgi:hypothetical protein